MTIADFIGKLISDDVIVKIIDENDDVILKFYPDGTDSISAELKAREVKRWKVEDALHITVTIKDEANAEQTGEP